MENVLQWSALVTQIAPLYAITPTVALAIIAVETGWTGDQNMVTPGVQATGLMQVVPGEVIEGRPSSALLKSPRINVNWGCYLLRGYINQKGSLYKALYFYSGGGTWPSWDKYERRYWLLFRRAQLTIQSSLPESRPEFNDR